MSKRRIDTDRPIIRQLRGTLFTLVFVFSAMLLIPITAGAQAYGGFGDGGSGMMGGGGMMGGRETQGEQQLTLARAMSFLEQSTATARVDKTRNRVIFTGTHVLIAMAAVQPGFPDTTFEVAGLVDPTIVVPAGASITLLLVNMDYGPDMDHGVVVTDISPPYPVLSMMGMRRALTGVPVLPPRSLEDEKAASYAAESVTFTAPPSGGSYFYLCQYRDHASKGMFGRFEVR